MSSFDSPENWSHRRDKASQQACASRKRRSDAIEVDDGSSTRKRRPGLPPVGSFDAEGGCAGMAKSAVIDLTWSDGEEDKARRVRDTSMPKSTTSRSRFTGFKMDLKPNPIKRAMVEYAKATQTQDNPLPCAPPRPLASTQTTLDMFRLEPQADTTASAAPTQQWHTVRVGWFTGIYKSQKEAENLLVNYPYHEYAVFATFDEAKVWLRQSSIKVQRDRAIRPQQLNHVEKNAFMRFVGRSFDKQNQVPGVDERAIARKLLLLLKQACDDVGHDVNWTMQPLPQALILQEREKVQDKPGCSASLGLWIGAKTLRPDAQQSAVHHATRPTRSTPASSSPSIVPAAASSSPLAGPLCSCGEAIVDFEIAVKCAGGECKYELFHRTCAGFTKRSPAPGWRCWQCRPKPVVAAPASSQALPGSSPPTMNSIPMSRAVPAGRQEAQPELHPEQARVVDAIMQGGNVFYTGSAGVGKSTVLKAFVTRLQAEGKQVDIIAPSGIAALNVGGMTIYAYAGWYPDLFKEPLSEFIKRSWNKSVRKRLCSTDVLVIDEISMVERDILVRLDQMMRAVRARWQPEKGQKRNSRHGHSYAFGGAQVVVTGDFCQLPPVKPFKYCMDCGGDELPGHSTQDGRTLECRKCKQRFPDGDKWAFRSHTWESCNFSCHELRHIHRQSDRVFIDMLQKCRYGVPLSPADRTLLLKPKADPVGAVRLLPRRDEVNAINTRNFNGLRSPARKYECHDFFNWRNKDEPDLARKGELKYPGRANGPLKALSDHRFEEHVELKEGMLVILLVNLDFTTGLVNGSQGKIIGFEKYEDIKVFPPEEKRAPDLMRRGAGSGSEGAADETQSEHARIKEAQVRAFIGKNTIRQWPVVAFQNGTVQAIYPQCQLNELGSEKPYSHLGRTQMPLIAAWAITIHKSQGMTLNSVIVELFSSFEKEMVYVALSRARSLQGLKVERLARKMELGGGNKEVQDFLRAHGIGVGMGAQEK